MRNYKTIKVKKDVEYKVICNKCSECIYEDGYPDWLPHLNVEYSYGFFAPKGMDLTSIEFDLCEGCLYKFTKTFKIKPKTTEYNPGV